MVVIYHQHFSWDLPITELLTSQSWRMFLRMGIAIVYMDQESYLVWRNHFHKVLLFKGSSDYWVLLEHLATTRDRTIVGFISLRSKSTTVDGSVDVSTPIIIPMWKSILDTPFGPWRMISYAPLLVLRQFGVKQFIPVTIRLASLEIAYGKLEEVQLFSQVIQTWKDPHRTMLGQLIGGCTPKYTI